MITSMFIYFPKVGQHAGISPTNKKLWVGQHARMVGQHEQEWWVNMRRNLYTEVYYRSRGGFEGGCFTSKGAWSSYLKLERFDGKSYVWLEAADLTTLYGLLEQAKAKM